MSRTTIDYGIDLGTTNSAIAVLEDVRPVIIKNNRDQDITPSAVSMKKDGAVLLGERARGAWVSSIDDAHIEFKRRMGTGFLYDFKSSGRQMKPEELSAEVLKALRADVLARCGEDIQAAVITIPAAFELHQCEATQRAGQLAGFRTSPLLQEPVAAALAYGFQADMEKNFWMVYDFGGGTFDAALIKAEDGIINVVNHGGDNFLGGSDIDWAIVEQLVIPRLSQQYDLPDFRRGNKRWEVALRKLKRSVENAKIELSRSVVSSLDECVFTDASGNEIEVDLTLSVADVARASEPIIRRSAAILRGVLKEKRLDASALSRLILVGGPTKAPYFRDQLRSELGMDLDLSIDPMTAVAEGAAVFAGTQRLDSRSFRAATAIGEFALDLRYKPVSHEPDPLVAGRAAASGGVTNFAGYSIEFVNARSQWRSGRIPLKADGAFMATLLAEKGGRNTFDIELVSPVGARQNTVPGQIVYTIGATVEEQPLSRSIGIAFEDNSVDWFFEKGTGLPQRKRGRQMYRTVQPIVRGSEDALVIPLVEGELDAADRNRKVGELRVRGTDVKRDIPAGAEIEITLRIDESRLLRMDAYIPTLDQDFPCEVNLSKYKLTPDDLNARWSHEQDRVHIHLRKADQAEDRDAQRELKALQNSDLVADITRELSAATTDPDACEKADKRLLEFALKIDDIEVRLAWPTAVAKAQNSMAALEEVSERYAGPEHRLKVESLSQDLETCIHEKDSERLQRKQRDINSLYSKIVVSQDSFWIEHFRAVESRSALLKDQARGSQLIMQGHAYLSMNNLDGLRNTVHALWQLLPRDQAEQLKRGVGSSLAKG